MPRPSFAERLSMDSEHFDSLVRALGTTPSRRAVTRTLASLMTGSLLVPLIGHTRIEAKKKKGHKKKTNKEKFCKDHYGGPYCPANKRVGFSVPCCVDRDVCTECGCCEQGSANCCLSPSDPKLSKCCADNESCCTGPGGVTNCCRSDESCCGGKCCPPDNRCCNGVTCCHVSRLCCPDNSCPISFC